MTLLYIALLMFIVTRCLAIFSYDGYKVYKVEVETMDDVNHLKLLKDQTGFDFWQLTSLLGSNATVMVDQKYQESFEKSLDERKMKYDVAIEDLEKVFATERLFQLKQLSQGTLTFERYLTYEEINAYLDSFADNPLVKVEEVGKTFEGRVIKTMTISKSFDKKKNSVFIDAGIHGREWIAPATALYLINQLTDPTSEASKLLYELDFIILPLVNPDSYHFAHTEDRLWRKTRSNNSNECVGTDGNRNFEFHWGELGTSNDPCSDIYIGQNSFSEIETRVVRDIAVGLAGTCKFYLSLHSYGDFLLYPWAWTKLLPKNWKEIDKIGRVGAEAIKAATGKTYIVGSTSNVLSESAGRSDDYMLATVGIPIAMTMDLPGGGHTGYDPAASSILGLVKESSSGVFAMAKAVAEKYSTVT